MIDEFLRTSGQYFFMDIVMNICLISAIIVSFSKSAGGRFKYLLRLYLFLALLEMILSYCSQFVLRNSSGLRIAVKLVNFLFILFELFVIYFIVYKCLKSVQTIRVLKSSILLFAITFFSYTGISYAHNKFGYFKGIGKYLIMPYVVVNLFLIIPGVLYFYELFKLPPQEKKLKNSDIFWIVTGFFFYACCTIPPILMNSYIEHMGYISPFSLYSFNYLMYAILYSMIGKSFLCKTA